MKKRGRYKLEPVLYDLKGLQDFRKYRVMLNKICSSVVIVHKKRGGSSELQGVVDKNKSHRGSRTNKKKLPTAGTHMSIDAESEIEFKSPNLGSSEAEIDYRMITLAKSIEEKQVLLEEEFCRIYGRVINHAVARGKLPRDASVKCSFAFPSFNIRDIEAEARS